MAKTQNSPHTIQDVSTFCIFHDDNKNEVFSTQPTIELRWSEFLGIFSGESNESAVYEIVEFLKGQDYDTLPQELKELMKWHVFKLEMKVRQSLTITS